MAPTTRSSRKKISSNPQAGRTVLNINVKRQAPKETPAAEPPQKEAPMAKPWQKTFPCTYADKHHCDETFQTQVEASCHAILNHRVSPVHMTEDRQFICLHAELGCSATFQNVRSLERHLSSEHRGKAFPCPLAQGCDGTSTLASFQGVVHHVRAIHQRIRHPCPVAEDTGCTATFARASGAAEHVKDVHAHWGKQHLCPLAKEHKCTELFYRLRSAEIHADIQHKGLRFSCPRTKELGCTARFISTVAADIHVNQEHERNPYPCPLAEKYDCDKRFDRRDAARKHVNRDHKGVRFPCPRAEDLGCSATFVLKRSAIDHALVAHDQLRFPCPCADAEDCGKVFGSVQQAKIHADAVHRNIKYPCPLADEYNCHKKFATKSGATTHSKIHLAVRIPCPVADQFGCQMEFWLKLDANRHAKVHTHAFLCQHKHCRERFVTAKDAIQHSYSPKHSLGTLFLCTIPGCQSAVAGQRFQRARMSMHHKKHVEVGDIGIDDEFVAQPVEGSPVRSQLPLFFSILEHSSLDLTGATGADDDDTLETSGSDDEDQGGETLAPWEDQEESSSLCIGTLSKEHQRQVHESNTAKWSGQNYCSVGLTNLGYKCVGPSSLKHRRVDERCPNNTTIDLDTARLIFTGRSTYQYTRLHLHGRCVACHSEHQKGCTQLSVHGSIGCGLHFGKLLIKVHLSTKFDPRQAQEVFKSAARDRWVTPPSYDIVRRRMQEISEGERPGLDLVILDDEFSLTSRQLWEFSFIERMSGDVLINTTIEHQDGLDHTGWGHSCMKMASQAQAKHVFSSTRSNIDRMTVHQVAARLKEVGIRPETIILVWHTSTADLTMLRKFLESAGYLDILPPDKNCIPLINLFRPNLPKVGQRLFPMKLEVLFPIMYPRHSLIGLNHQAVVDCQQTRLVCMGFDELCKPVEERGWEWQPETVARSSQKSILDWLIKKHGVENGTETYKRKDT